MDIYYINLDRSPQRRQRIEACLEKFGLPFKRVRAVDANELSEAEIREWNNPDENPYGYFSTLKKAEIGCFLSHRKVLQEFLENSADEFVVILEDDAEFVKDPAPVFNALQEKIKGSGEPLMIKLFSRRNNKAAKLADLVPGTELVLPEVCPLNTSAQVFNRAGAIRFLESTCKIHLPVDVTLQFASDMPLLVLQVRPNLVQGVDEEVGGSTIAAPKQPLSLRKVSREFRRAVFRFRVWLRARLRGRRPPSDIRVAILK